MRILFAGTPAFAASALEALLGAGHTIVAVLTQPDRPAKRGLNTVAGAVKVVALKHGLPVFQFPSLKPPGAAAALRELRADVMVVSAFGMLMPRAVLEATPLGSLNIHASLLPRWRGAAPIARAILAGDRETGISIMKMNEGLDTGPVLMQKSIPIGDADTAKTLHDRLAALGAEMIVHALPLYAQGELVPSPQFETGATYAAKIEKEEAKIDWRKSAVEVSRAVRAFNPAPGAFTHIDGEQVKLWMAKAREELGGAPGEVLAVTSKAVLVACGCGAVAITEMQKAGGRRLPASELARGFRLIPGSRFG